MLSFPFLSPVSFAQLVTAQLQLPSGGQAARGGQFLCVLGVIRGNKGRGGHFGERS
jgi:hypothetical protein